MVDCDDAINVSPRTGETVEVHLTNPYRDVELPPEPFTPRRSSKRAQRQRERPWAR